MGLISALCPEGVWSSLLLLFVEAAFSILGRSVFFWKPEWRLWGEYLR